MQVRSQGGAFSKLKKKKNPLYIFLFKNILNIIYRVGVGMLQLTFRKFVFYSYYLLIDKRLDTNETVTVSVSNRWPLINCK